MDVRDLAAALLSIRRLFNAVNYALNDDRIKIKVHVTAMGGGSFEVFLELSQTVFETLFISGFITNAKEIVELITGGAEVRECLISLFKRVKGRTDNIKVTKLNDEYFQLTVEGEKYVLAKKVLSLYQDRAVQAAIDDVIHKPLQHDGLGKVTFSHGMHQQVINESEAEYFAQRALPEDIVSDSIRRQVFSIVAAAFKEGNKWKMYDGVTSVWVTIADKDFLQRVGTSQIQFAKDDLLVCDVRVIQKRINNKLKNIYIVEEVVEHRPAMRQVKMDFNEP